MMRYAVTQRMNPLSRSEPDLRLLSGFVENHEAHCRLKGNIRVFGASVDVNFAHSRAVTGLSRSSDQTFGDAKAVLIAKLEQQAIPV
jgi:hypothetical protein